MTCNFLPLMVRSSEHLMNQGSHILLNVVIASYRWSETVLAHAMLQTHNAGNIGFDNSGELAGVKMALFTMTMIVNRTGFTVARTG